MFGLVMIVNLNSVQAIMSTAKIYQLARYGKLHITIYMDTCRAAQLGRCANCESFDLTSNLPSIFSWHPSSSPCYLYLNLRCTSRGKSFGNKSSHVRKDNVKASDSDLLSTLIFPHFKECCNVLHLLYKSHSIIMTGTLANFVISFTHWHHLRP